jgi:hypothetical protein
VRHPINLAIGGLLFALAAQTAKSDSTWVYAVQISATTQTSPPQITLNWEPDQYGANSYTVYRKAKDANSWGGGTTLSGSASSFVDTSVAVGSAYEYQIVKAASKGYTGYGYIYAGINVPVVDNRGKVVLVVDNTYASQLASELTRLQSDLAGDGWTVVRRDVGRGDTPASVRSTIQAVYSADPGNVKAVFLFGHVPILRSGNLNVDGHLARPMPADPYYGDMDGTWDNPSFIPSDVELMVGRVDMFNLPGNGAAVPWPSEVELLRNYLNKDHNWRQKVFTVPQKALIGNRFGDFNGEAFAASGFRNFEPFVGPGNIVLANEQDAAPVDQKWSSMLTAGTYLWAYGCGGGSYTSMSGMGTHGTYNDIWSTDIVGGDAKAVFFMMFGSWLGEWDSTDDIMRSALATSSMGLTCSWAGRPHWYYHHMGLGEPIGYSARVTQNNNGLYQNQVNLNLRGVHIALMGDPTLRMHIVAPPSSVTTSTSGSTVTVNWSPSPDSVVGYHVYRAASSTDPFTRLTSSTVSGTSFTDTSAPGGTSVYMVRAVKLETTPSGAYFNASQGAYANGTSSGGGGGGTASVTITAPANGATLSGAAVTLSGTVANIPSVAGVQFKLDGANLGAEDTSAPFSLIWDTTLASNGSHHLLAVARDSSGTLTSSPEVIVTVNNLVVSTNPPPSTNTQFWVDDVLPAGAVAGADGGDAWTWVSSSPAPFSGTLASQSTIAAGSHQHYFSSATATLGIGTGDVLVAYVYLDPANIPSEIMLQWNDGSWEHRAYWGANHLTYGVDGTTSRKFMGSLPAAGQWVRLEVPASQVALEGSVLKGMAFTLFDGRATWDAAGKASGSSGGSGGDSTPPVVAMTAPTNNSIVSGSSIAVSATASDNVGVAGVQFRIDGANLGAEDPTAPYSVVLNTTTVANGLHTLQAIASDAAGNHATSAIVNVLVTNAIASTSTNNDFVWVEDSVPNGAVPGADGGDAWTWVSSSPAPFSGTAAHQSNLSSASHQHYFSFAWTTLPVNTGDVLFAYVYLDPANPPQEVMLQWTNGSWEHRAYWGANLNSYGVDGTSSRRSMGALPELGKWVRLEVPARSVGLEGSTVQGMAFTLWGGKATWDRAGKATSSGLVLRKASTGMALTWSSAEGQSYRVLCRSNLLSGDWTDISGTITATNSVTTWTDTGTDSAPQRFYKISQ